jgi:putative transposase
MARSMMYYRSKRDDSVLIRELTQMAENLPSRGLDEFVGRLRAKGHKWNRKRIYRVYKTLMLNKRKRPKKRLGTRNPEPLAQPIKPNICWSMDFMNDSLINGRKIRVLNVIDDFNREALCCNAQHSYPSEFVVRTLKDLEVQVGLPSKIRVDNGPEFLSINFKEFCETKGISIQYIEPGKPNQNAYIERFNRHLREDILDAYLLETVNQTNELLENWRDDYNQNHPHKSLKGASPNAYKELFSKAKIYSDSVKAKMNVACGRQP